MSYSKEMENAIKAVREFHKTAADLAAKRDDAGNKYRPEVAEKVKENIRFEYREARQKALDAINTSVSSVRYKINLAKREALARSAENPDFKILSLPVKLSADELRHLINKNANDALFLRAVREYAEKNGYNDQSVHKDIMCAGISNNQGALSGEQAITELERIFMRYIGDNYIPNSNDVMNSHVFEQLETQGIFEQFDNTFAAGI